jgi:hypothetical protein
MTLTDAVLKPGDCLLYKPSGFFGAVISIKTWHKIATSKSTRASGVRRVPRWEGRPLLRCPH